MKLNKFIVGILALAAMVVSLNAATTIGVNSAASSPFINSANAVTNIVVYPQWPNLAQGTVTNWTEIDISRANNVALQFTASSTNTTTTSNVVWTVYRSVQGLNPTNAAGTSVNAEVLGYVTNVLNGVTPVTTVAVYTTLPKTTAVGNQSTDLGIAGVQSLYIATVNTPSNSGITNYSVFAGGK